MTRLRRLAAAFNAMWKASRLRWLGFDKVALRLLMLSAADWSASAAQPCSAAALNTWPSAAVLKTAIVTTAAA